jgi:phage regulator Rha-like protein
VAVINTQKLAHVFNRPHYELLNILKTMVADAKDYLRFVNPVIPLIKDNMSNLKHITAVPLIGIYISHYKDKMGRVQRFMYINQYAYTLFVQQMNTPRKEGFRKKMLIINITILNEFEALQDTINDTK